MMESVIGFMTGVLASMGLGGGFILVVWLTLFSQTDQKTAQGINVLFFLAASLPALIIHFKNHLVNIKLVKQLALGGIIGAVLGTTASCFITSELLRKIFAVFLIGFGIREIITCGNKENKTENPAVSDRTEEKHSQ